MNSLFNVFEINNENKNYKLDKNKSTYNLRYKKVTRSE